MQALLQRSRHHEFAERDVESLAFRCTAHRTDGVVGRLRKRRQPEHRPILPVDGILGPYDAVTDGNADPESILADRCRHHAPVRLPIRQHGAEHGLSVRKFSPYLDPRCLVDADH